MRTTAQSTRPSDVTRRTALKGIGATAVAALAPVRLRAQSEHVIVIGAGLAGLYAAMLLEEEEVKVTLLEATDRIGGRVITLDDVPGNPEAGFSTIGGLYSRTFDLCTRLEIPLEKVEFASQYPVDPKERRPENMLYINGQTILPSDWPTSPLNPFPAEDKEQLPATALAALLLRDNPLGGLEDWLKPEFFELDISLHEYLKPKGLSEEAVRLMDVANMNGGLKNHSTLNEMRILHWIKFGANADTENSRSIVGGMETLPKKMAARLKTEVRFNKVVVQISSTDSDVEVFCVDGSTYKADRVITTLPYCVLRDVTIDPTPPPAQLAAIGQLPSSNNLQIYLFPEKPYYWEEDGLPARMWTDTPLDNVSALKNAQTGETTSIICQINSGEAQRYSLMSEAEIGAYALRWFEKVRPASKGKLRVVKIVDKTRYPYERGCWSYWRPGQVRQFGREMRKPWKHIHFAGDGTAVLNRGAEAAFESGERAAVEVLLAL